MPFEEQVLCDFGEGTPIRQRFMPQKLLTPGCHTILEHRHLFLKRRAGDTIGVPITEDHFWFDTNERTVSGHRVFREAPKPVAPEPVENPLYDELHVLFGQDVPRITSR